MTRPFRLVDVFGSKDFAGNPLAVVAQAEGLSGEEMLAITRWLNLSETTFLLAPATPAADYFVRIFTLSGELPFAGHPTLGSAHAWLEAGGKPKQAGVIVQECGVGLVNLRQEAGQLAFCAPPLRRSGPASAAEITEIIEILQIPRDNILAAEWVDNGPGWVAVMLASAEAVLAVEPSRQIFSGMKIGIVGPHAPGRETAWEIRAILGDAQGGLLEDPVTGSLNASVGQWLFASGRARGKYIASQGARVGRSGRIYVEQDAAGRIWVGGATRTLFQGQSFT